MSLAEMGDYLRDIVGFRAETYRVVSWFLTVDTTVFLRAIHGHSQLLDRSPPPSMAITHINMSVARPFCLARTLRHCTDLQRVTCGYVYRSLTGDLGLKMHDPYNDTLAYCRILIWYLVMTEKWLMGNMAGG